MPPVQISLYVLVSVALAVSVVTDVRKRLIYDVVTLPTAALALVLRFGLVGMRGTGDTAAFGLLPGLIGLGVGFGAFFVMMLLGGMGGGDVKLMAAVGAVLGFPVVLYALIFTGLVGGLQAIVVLLWDGTLFRTLLNSVRMAADALRIKRIEGERPPRKYVPYGIAIALGTIWAVVWDFMHPIGANVI